MKLSIAYPPVLQRWPGDAAWCYDDALDAIRGIMAGTILSVLLFWIPLAIALTG